MADRLRYLVEQLIVAHPDCYPPISLSDKEFAFRAGQIDIIRRLKTAVNDFNPDLDLT